MSIIQHMEEEKIRKMPQRFLDHWGQALLAPHGGMTYAVVPAEFPYKWVHQEHYLFIMNLEGQGLLKYPRELSWLRQGEMVLLPPHTPVSLKPDTGWSLTILVIQCLQVQPPALHANPWNHITLPVPVPHPAPSPLFHELEGLRRGPDYPDRGRYRTPYRVIVHALLQELLALYLLEGFAQGLLTETSPIPAPFKRANNLLRKGIKNPEFTVKQLAVESGMSTNHLIAGFRQHYGQTPAQFLHQYRVRLAAHLLTGNPDVTLEHIAHRCGYRDRSSLHRQFRKRMGQSPGEYRKKSPGLPGQRPAIHQAP